MIYIFKQVLEVALYSSIVILLTLCIRVAFGHKLDIKILSFLWIIVLFRLILPVTFNSPVHYDELIVKDNQKSELVQEKSISTPVMHEENELVTLNDNSDIVEDFENQNHNIATVQSQIKDTKNTSIIQGLFEKIDIWHFCLYAWITGMIFLLIFQMYKIFDFNKKLKTSRFVADKELYQMLYKSKQKLKIKRNFYLFECDYIDSPVTCGLFFPKVLLPSGLKEKLSNEKLNLIIMHELCHIKNNDIFKNYLWMISTVVYWFNPLVYLGYRAYLEDIEYVSDGMVLKSLDKKGQLLYSQSLIDVLRLSRLNFSSPIALSFCKSKTKLRKRVENMLKPKEKSKTFALISIVLIVIAVVGCFTTACQKSEEVDSFSGEKEIVEPKEDIQKAPEQKEEIADKTQEAIHIKTKTILESEKYILNIDADVVDYGDREFNVYNAKPMDIDADAWKDYFMSDLDESKIKKYNEIIYYGLDLKDEDIALLDDSFGYVYKSGGREYTYEYMPITGRVTIARNNYNMIDSVITTLSPEETKYKEIVDKANEALSFMTNNEFYVKGVKTRNLEGGDTRYETEYHRLIDDFEVLCDNPLYADSDGDIFIKPIKADRIRIWVVNNNISKIRGYIRDIKKTYASKIISADKVMKILSENVDEIDAYNENGNPQNGEKAYFDINSIVLNYYPVLHEDESLHDTYTGISGYATYRPVYVISSGWRLESRFHYVMIIDAITGEVLNKDELGDNHIFDVVSPPLVSGDGGYDMIAQLTGDYFDYEITYINKKVGEELKYTVDNSFCWLLDTQEWANAGGIDDYTPEKDLKEWIDIRGCKVVRENDIIYLYHDNIVYKMITDPIIFDKMVNKIKLKQ